MMRTGYWQDQVAPPAGAWIETLHRIQSSRLSESRPLRARGLKQNILNIENLEHKVAPPAGAWIETDMYWNQSPVSGVAPPAGAWIETSPYNVSRKATKSRPLRARGLKRGDVGG